MSESTMRKELFRFLTRVVSKPPCMAWSPSPPNKPDPCFPCGSSSSKQAGTSWCARESDARGIERMARFPSSGNPRIDYQR